MTRDELICDLYLADTSVTDLVVQYNLTRARIYQILAEHDVPRRRSQATTPKEKKPMRYAAPRESNGSIARFVAPKVDTERAYGLRSDHPALVESRTLFPTRVKSAAEARHYLIDGKNNSKIGGRVTKGPWTGMPIFTLTLEERATCPASCAQWSFCYGNGMQFAQRWSHTDPDFEDFLRAEIITKCRENPEGLVIRLHVLGDFYSLDYVRLWVDMIDRFPQLHVYGYTARREDADDEDSRAIAAALRRLAERCWDQFALRFSYPEPGRMRTIVVDSDPGLEDVIVCPAQTEKTPACATCGLCWAEGARNKTVAFLRHGMKRATGTVKTPREPKPPKPPKEPKPPKPPKPVVKAPTPERRPVTASWAEPKPKKLRFVPKAFKPDGSRDFRVQMGTAADFDIGTAEERIAKIDENERARIAAAYGAAFKVKE